MKQALSKIALSLGFIAAATAFNVAQAATLVATTSTNQLYTFDSANVGGGTLIGINGLLSGESFVGIDLRPTNNTIYGITSANNLYTLDASTGFASLIAGLSNTGINNFSIQSGVSYGVDFNPVADRTAPVSFRVVSSTGDNVAVNATTGVVSVQKSIAKDFSAIAYSNSDSTTPTVNPGNTQLYYLNAETDTLSIATTAFNNPSISLISKIGINILSSNGFEIFNQNGINTGFAAVDIQQNKNKIESLFLGIDLITGEASNLGKFKFDGTLTGLAAAPSAVPVPAALPLMASALGLFCLSRRKNKASTV